MFRILYLAANPRTAGGTAVASLALDEEFRSIDQAILAARNASHFEIKPGLAVRTTDLVALFQRHRPQIVHFSGHGEARGLFTVNEAGEATLVPDDAVAALFETFRAGVRLVVLNACWSAGQAAAIVRHAEAAIGMANEIGDEAARLFAGKLYESLASGLNLQESFDLARLQVHLANLPDHLLPRLLTRPDVDPRKWFLLPPPPAADSAVRRGEIEVALRRIDRALEFKEAHDLLQEIEEAYRIALERSPVTPSIASPEPIDWPARDRSRKLLDRQLGRLQSFLASARIGIEERALRENLAEARTGLRSAIEQRNPGDFDEALERIDEILRRHLPTMDKGLMEAIEALALAGIVDALTKAPAPDGSTLPEPVAALAHQAAGLEQLRSIHRNLQELDDALRFEERRLATDPQRVRSQWTRRLRARFDSLFRDFPALPDSDACRPSAEAVSAACASEVSLPVFGDAFREFRGTVLSLFNGVDVNLKRDCDALRDVRGPLGRILQLLP